MKKLIFLFFFPFVVSAQTNAPKDVPFTYKSFLNLANFFDSKQQVIEFFDFKAGETIADIGAGAGTYEGAFSLLFDSLAFYIEDIDSTVLNQKSLAKTLARYSKLKGQALANTFTLRIGTDKTSNLPDTAFDKIIILSAFHEFTFKDQMVADLSRKLKPGGKLYIIDALCSRPRHVNYTAEQVVSKLKTHGFSLQSMDQTNKNGSQGLYKAVFYR